MPGAMHHAVTFDDTGTAKPGQTLRSRRQHRKCPTLQDLHAETLDWLQLPSEIRPRHADPDLFSKV
jgi:hypothetical protein